MFDYDRYNNITEKDEYDFGQSTQTRTTTTQYQSFPQTFASIYPYFPYNTTEPASTPMIVDRPCKAVVYAGTSSGTRVAETDDEYDGGSTVCGTAGTPSVSGVSGLISGTHDETNFSSSGTLSRGNATTAVKWASTGTSPTTTYTYDETGQALTKTDPCGNTTCSDMQGTSHTTTYTYTDDNTYLSEIMEPIVGATQYSYNNASGLLASTTDVNGQTTNYTYSDPFNRLTEVQGPPDPSSRPTTTYAFNDSSALTPPYNPSVTTTTVLNSSENEVQVAVNDPMGHLIQTQLTSDPYGTDYVNTAYDGEGLVLTKTNPFRGSSPPTNSTITYYYDALGRQTETSEQDGSVLKWCYDGVPSTQVSSCTNVGSVSTDTWVDSWDENSNLWQRTSNGLGQLVQVVEPGSLTTNYSYDVLNDLQAVHQLGNSGSDTPRVRTFSYDSLARLLCASNPENSSASCPATFSSYVTGTTGYSYDANSNVAAKTDARGVSTNYTYNALNQLLGKTYSNDASKTPSSCYQYGTSTSGNTVERLVNEWTQSASAGNCPSSVPATYLSWRGNMQYDPLGHLTSAQQQQCVGGVCSGPSPYSLSMLYDLAGNQTSLTNSVGEQASGGTQGSPMTLSTYFDAAARPCLTTSTWNSGFSPNLFQTNPSTSSPGYSAFGGLQNWYLGSNSSTAFSSCPTTPSPSTYPNLQQQFDTRMRLTGFSSTGQVPQVP